MAFGALSLASKKTKFTAVEIVRCATCFAFAVMRIVSLAFVSGMKFGSWFCFPTFLALLVSIRAKANVMQRSVNCLVLEKLKVVNVVVKTIAVFMVDNLGRKQKPSKMILHNVTMFKDSFAINEYNAISARHTSTFVIWIKWPAKFQATALFGAESLITVFAWSSGWDKTVSAIFANVIFHCGIL